MICRPVNCASGTGSGMVEQCRGPYTFLLFFSISLYCSIMPSTSASVLTLKHAILLTAILQVCTVNALEKCLRDGRRVGLRIDIGNA